MVFIIAKPRLNFQVPLQLGTESKAEAFYLLGLQLLTLPVSRPYVLSNVDVYGSSEQTNWTVGDMDADGKVFADQTEADLSFHQPH